MVWLYHIMVFNILSVDISIKHLIIMENFNLSIKMEFKLNHVSIV